MYVFFGIVLFIFVLALDVLAIVDCQRRNLASGAKSLWILGIIFLPVLGLLLYYFLGRGMVTARR